MTSYSNELLYDSLICWDIHKAVGYRPSASRTIDWGSRHMTIAQFGPCIGNFRRFSCYAPGGDGYAEESSADLFECHCTMHLARGLMRHWQSAVRQICGICVTNVNRPAAALITQSSYTYWSCASEGQEGASVQLTGRELGGVLFRLLGQVASTFGRSRCR